MKLEMTERDKKLLIMLSIFVIVVCIGYWGIYPFIKSIRSANTEIEEQEAIRDENDMKLAQVAILEKDSETMQEEIESARELYFPMMTSAEIDKYFTNLALSYNLVSYDLSIDMPEDETDLSPYQYSARATAVASGETADTTEESTGAVAEQEQIEEAEEAGGISSDEDITLDEPVTTGIYDAQITMRMGGEESDLKQLIEDFSNTEQKIRICSYSWSEQRSVSNVTEDGDYDIVTDRILTITFEVYMYQEDPDTSAEATTESE